MILNDLSNYTDSPLKKKKNNVKNLLPLKFDIKVNK